MTRTDLLSMSHERIKNILVIPVDKIDDSIIEDIKQLWTVDSTSPTDEQQTVDEETDNLEYLESIQQLWTSNDCNCSVQQSFSNDKLTNKQESGKFEESDAEEYSQIDAELHTPSESIQEQIIAEETTEEIITETHNVDEMIPEVHTADEEDIPAEEIITEAHNTAVTFGPEFDNMEELDPDGWDAELRAILSPAEDPIDAPIVDDHVIDDLEEQQIDYEVNELLNKKAPLHRGHLIRELNRRDSTSYPSAFLHQLYGSTTPAHLCKNDTVRHPQGGTVAINFSITGQRFVTASGKQTIAVWKMNSDIPLEIINCRQTSFLRQVIMLPHSDEMIITATHTGMISMIQLGNGKAKTSTLFRRPGGGCSSVSVNRDRPHEVLSCFADSTIYNIDVRAKPTFVLSCKDDKGNPLSLSSLKSDPRPNNLFCVTGSDQYIRIYDRRNNHCFCRYKPSNVPDSIGPTSINSMVYSNSGDSILASLGNGDIYLYSTSSSDMSNEIHKYSGHLNMQAVQPVCFFGNNSQYVMSGSDSNHLFIWDRNTEALLNVMPTYTENGISCLDVHPEQQTIASGDMCSDILNLWSWSPISDGTSADIRSIVRSNIREKLLSSWRAKSIYTDYPGAANHMSSQLEIGPDIPARKLPDYKKKPVPHESCQMQ